MEHKQKTLSEHAHAAKLIRREVKEFLPGVKASVRSDSYAGGDSVRVYVSDQPPHVSKKLNEIVAKYQYGHFDGMQDIYEHSNSRDDIPQVKFTFVQNSKSKELRINLQAFIENKYADPDQYNLLYQREFNDPESEFWTNQK